VSDTLVLGIESSCDETSAAVLRGDRELLGHVILSQDAHEVWGGVVPEIAARAHLSVLDRVVKQALREAGVELGDVDALGVTTGPGLIGALLVGVSWAKAAAFALDRPLVGVHHMEAHLFAPGIEDAEAEPPFVALLVSGGHTLLLHVERWGNYRLLGETRDDAAGEAYDKVARLLGLPYPGGPHVERLAARTAAGDAGTLRLPRPMLRRDQRPGDPDFYDFSFSGLKTAVAAAREEAPGDEGAARVAAAFQEAAVDVLVSKTLRAVKETGCPRVLLGGGVASNRGLREETARRLRRVAGREGRLFFASPRLSSDNGAMVARAARFHLLRGAVAAPDLAAHAALPFPGLERARRSGRGAGRVRGG
jgi:N6-L-threonylcarbamoyladenine synthase